LQHKLFVATGNKDKLREIRDILKSSDVLIVTADDISPYPEPEETGETLEENALLKAREGFLRTGLPSLADDTGIAVAALGGAPGVYSSRYAGENVTYADNVRKLLEELAGVPEGSRQASFRCVMALVDGSTQVCWDGEAHGEITLLPCGTNGFGYDPVFYSRELGKTFAEASLEEKNAVSHRGRALRKLAEEVRQIFDGNRE